MNNEENISEKLRILHERSSVRQFRPDQIPKSILMKLIQYANLAPSATNKQAWRFIIVTDTSLKQKTVEAGGSVLINNAPCGILVTYENTTRNIYYHDDLQSAAACIQNLLLAAQAYGLGACWVCTLPSKSFLRKLFNIPPSYSPVAYILLGYPVSDAIKDVPRKNVLEEIVSENFFPWQKLAVEQTKTTLYLERLLICLYRKTPVFIKKRILNKIVDHKFTMKFDN